MSSVPPPSGAPSASAAPGVTPPPGDEESPWRLWMAPAAIALGFGLGLVGSIAVSVIAGATGSSLSHPTPAVTLVENLVFDLGFVGAAIYFGITTGRLTAAAFGFRRVALGVGAAAFLAGGLAYYVLTAVYATVFSLHGSDKLPSELGVHRSTAALIGAAVFVCVVAPIAEETFFRGFVFGALRRWQLRIGGRELGTVLAAIVTGILFGLAHTGSANPQYLVPLGFLGFILCLIRWRTGSLYPCMALHSFNNSLALGLNELHWNAAGILGLMAGALLVIAVLTGPLGTRGAAAAGSPFLPTPRR